MFCVQVELVCLLLEVLLYVHKNCRFIRDGSPGCPPQLSHSSWVVCLTCAQFYICLCGERVCVNTRVSGFFTCYQLDLPLSAFVELLPMCFYQSILCLQVGFFKPKGPIPTIAYTAGHQVGFDGIDSNGTRTYNMEAVENGGLWHGGGGWRGGADSSNAWF